MIVNGGKMKLLRLICLAMLIPLSTVSAQVLHLRVETDQPAYQVGQTVNWTIYAWADSGTNQGIAGITLDLDDTAGEALTPALMNGPDFQDTEFGTPEKFVSSKSGTPSASPPRLHSLLTLQLPTPTGIGPNIGNDDLPHVLCKGSYTTAVIGVHTLQVQNPTATYWTTISGPLAPFLTIDPNNATFDVILEPLVCGDPGTVYLDADLNQNCYVNLFDYNVLASQFANVCTGPSWCLRADINKDTAVNLLDLFLFCNQWLYCTDPTNATCDPYW